jgi:3-phenylpropionate/trans-cinnamate dioxygenase ferredoxin subunit
VHCGTKELECWKHGSAFSLVTGAPNTLPATQPVTVYDVTVEGDDVYVTPKS